MVATRRSTRILSQASSSAGSTPGLTESRATSPRSTDEADTNDDNDNDFQSLPRVTRSLRRRVRLSDSQGSSDGGIRKRARKLAFVEISQEDDIRAMQNEKLSSAPVNGDDTSATDTDAYLTAKESSPSTSVASWGGVTEDTLAEVHALDREEADIAAENLTAGNPEPASPGDSQSDTDTGSATDAEEETDNGTRENDTPDLNVVDSDEESAGTTPDEDSEDDGEDLPLALRRRPRARARNRGRGQGRAAPRVRKSHQEITNEKLISRHPELATVWEDLENKTKAEAVPVEQPKDLVLPLLPFQKRGVGWMRQQEELNDFKGGVLADEMGMGKTIQTIALMLSDKKRPNLVIAPVVALTQWKSEIENHTNNALKVYIFHGNKREGSAAHLNKFDVVLSTYSLVEIAFRHQEVGQKKYGKVVKTRSPLHQIHWHRIILDEAHNIKDRSRNTARSVFNLEGNFRWSLTGTPLQNRVGELYSLIRFMEADPFGYYFCKKCPCKKLNWEFSDKKGCDSCGHKPMDHVCWWNNEILKPIQNHGHIGEGRVAFKKLGKLLDKMMLRRTKLQCADDLGLPPRTVVVRRDIFNEEEEEMYKGLYSDSARQFSDYVEEGSVLNNYANIFELLTRMRQSANHIDLVTKKNTDNKQLVCMLCNEPPEDAIAATCRHVFCRECCVQYIETFNSLETDDKAPRCPSCYANFNVDLTQPAMDTGGAGEGAYAGFSKTSIVNRIDMNNWRSSTKIEALVEELSKLRTEDKTIKSIVFSQFVNFLDLVYWRLSRAGFYCIRLDGTMSLQQRDAAIKQFMTNPTCTVFLISLKAGGVALNLTEASRVFICDPWWNPAAELQAMDRIHRLGQHRPIRITRLIIGNSIESRIVQLQEKKQALVESTVDKNDSALDRLSVEDLRFLFVM